MSEENNNAENNRDRVDGTQKMFEDGMPESMNSNAIPSSLDELQEDNTEAGEQNAGRDENLAGSGEPEASGNDRKDDMSTAPDKQQDNSQQGIVRGARQLSSEAHSHIKGWGIDADPANDPTYPIKSRTNEEQLGNTWERPTLQEQDVELLMSVERNNVPAVFSTVNPPKGLSGMIKRKAFEYSESDYRHWLGLVVSDKIGVLEGKIDDLRHGHIPNPIAEHGLKSEWKYNRKEFVRKTAVKAAVTGAAIGLILLSRKPKKKTGIMENIVKAIR